jgi:aspartyl-tRNA(Asn)/glutamyl-tRNA(Gln) amidotransferase subunit B
MSTSAPTLATPETIARYETVIGLEVHCQLATNTKIFCSCPIEFGSAPNTNVCPVCLGMPGALPVLSRHAVELAIQASLALNCEVRGTSIFARKNYFYPDLPKGYQISQYDRPLSEHGWLDIVADGVPKRIGITRVHMEDDAGKSTHDGFRDSDEYTYVDLNRTGAPLIEIVSEPDMRGSEEAFQYLTEMKQILQYVGVSACDMEKGQLRCDANVSVRPRGQAELGTKAELKNLNSFRFVKQAIDYEVARQVGLIESGGRVRQESRLYNVELGETFAMRSKEQAHDYRYFPEPDLLPLKISDEWLSGVRAALPELPTAKRKRFIEEFGLSEYDAQVLTQTRAMAEFYEQVASESGNPKLAAGWTSVELMSLLKADGKEIDQSPVTAAGLAELVGLIAKGELTGKIAKEVLPKMYQTGDPAQTIVEREGLKAISDTGELEKIADEVIARNPKQVEQYRGGKTSVLAFFVGQLMKATRGQADPPTASEILKRKLG